MGRNRVRGRSGGRHSEKVRGISDLNKVPFRRWKSAVKTALREQYRTKKNVKIELNGIEKSDNDRTTIVVSILAQGSIQKRYNTCGKSKCRCNKRGEKHGPYWYLSLPMPMEMVRKGAPRIKQFYINEEEALMLKARIANFQTIQKKVWHELYEELTKGGYLDERVLKYDLYH